MICLTITKIFQSVTSTFPKKFYLFLYSIDQPYIGYQHHSKPVRRILKIFPPTNNTYLISIQTLLFAKSTIYFLGSNVKGSTLEIKNYLSQQIAESKKY